jgi:signal transduction histidine kinase/ActR/RegA family two-component response regulator
MASNQAVAGRVLVLMPTRRDAERTAQLLAEAQVPSTVCADLTEMCRELRVGAGALLLTEEELARDAAGQLAESLRQQPAWSAVPVLLLAREGWYRHGESLAAPVFDGVVVVERPVRTRTLVSVVSSALRGRRQQYQIRDAILLRERQAAELMAQKESLRFALSAGGMGAWELDLRSYELHSSDICKANYGRDIQAPFTYREQQEAIHPDDRQRVRAAMEESVASGADYDVEYRICWPNGETRWLMVRGRATHDDTGQPLRMAGISLDITERKRMHESLRQSESELARQAEELRTASRRKDEFLATLAHELRNPLAPIRTGLELLDQAQLSQGQADPGQQRTLGVMHRQLGHMVRLIDDLLDVSRITRGKLELKRERITLGSAITAALEASRPLIARRQHELVVSVPDPSLPLDADLTRIAQVVSNLLNNASNYTPAGGRIELAVEQQRDRAAIIVRDNGIGIPPDRLEDVFEMFSQVSRTLDRSQGGLGIGLALVRSLVEMHGGSVRAESAGSGQGSTFTVSLPLASAALSTDPNQPAALLAQDLSKRILVVDDNEDAAELLTISLQQLGYRTETAFDGPSALTRAADFQPQIAILDIGLPGMSGYELARSLRQAQRSAELSLIALTGWGSPDDKRKALEAGFDLHLTKPVDARVLNDALAQLERRSKSPLGLASHA